tara:strand:- start:1266 stop:2990 length:1725 start_codon:yes stop_codon:yes gene_type:complete
MANKDYSRSDFVSDATPVIRDTRLDNFLTQLTKDSFDLLKVKSLEDSEIKREERAEIRGMKKEARDHQSATSLLKQDWEFKEKSKRAEYEREEFERVSNSLDAELKTLEGIESDVDPIPYFDRLIENDIYKKYPDLIQTIRSRRSLAVSRQNISAKRAGREKAFYAIANPEYIANAYVAGKADNLTSEAQEIIYSKNADGTHIFSEKVREDMNKTFRTVLSSSMPIDLEEELLKTTGEIININTAKQELGEAFRKEFDPTAGLGFGAGKGLSLEMTLEEIEKFNDPALTQGFLKSKDTYKDYQTTIDELKIRQNLLRSEVKFLRDPEGFKREQNLQELLNKVTNEVYPDTYEATAEQDNEINIEMEKRLGGIGLPDSQLSDHWAKNLKDYGINIRDSKLFYEKHKAQKTRKKIRKAGVGTDDPEAGFAPTGVPSDSTGVPSDSTGVLPDSTGVLPDSLGNLLNTLDDPSQVDASKQSVPPTLTKGTYKIGADNVGVTSKGDYVTIKGQKIVLERLFSEEEIKGREANARVRIHKKRDPELYNKVLMYLQTGELQKLGKKDEGTKFKWTTQTEVE